MNTQLTKDNRKLSIKEGPNPIIPRILIAVIACVGVALALLSLYEYSNSIYSERFGVEIAHSFCNINDSFNCDAINKSIWSNLFGLPLAAYALSFYLGVMAFVLATSSGNFVERKHEAGILLVLSTFTVILSVGLFGVSKFLIQKYCIVCIGLYVVSISFFVTAVLGWWGVGAVSERLKSGISALLAFPMAIIGLNPTSIKMSGGSARLIAVIMVLALGIGAIIPDFYFFRIIHGSDLGATPATEEIERAVEEQIAKWRAAEIVPSLTKIDGEDIVRGHQDAPITMIEYADFECPACQQFALVVAELLANYPDSVRYVFRQLPFDMACNPQIQKPFHANSCFAATLAICAAEQGKYWDMVDYLFGLGLESSGHVSPRAMHSKMSSSVSALSLDDSQIQSCISERRYARHLNRDLESAMKQELVSTPSIYINGKKVESISYQVLAAIVDELMAQ